MNNIKYWVVFVFGTMFLISSVPTALSLSSSGLPASNDPQYLTFQIFSAEPDPKIALGTKQLTWTLANAKPGVPGAAPLGPPPPKEKLAAMVQAIIDAVGTTGKGGRKLGFMVGPLAFDQTDEEIRRLIQDSFQIAVEKDIAVGFHIDDSKFWARRIDLWRNPNNIEWRDWNGTLSTGLKLDWGPAGKAAKLAPQMCFNSRIIQAEVYRLATDVIGKEIRMAIEALTRIGKQQLFAGVIAGWETGIGRDFDSEKVELGYCALTNRGFTEANPPPDLDRERERVVYEFIELWTGSLREAGLPKQQLYSHVVYLPKPMYESRKKADPVSLDFTYSQMIGFAPPWVGYNIYAYPGFSTYEASGLFTLHRKLQLLGVPRWASSEGANVDPAMKMENYLGLMFNHGATLTNIFGWGLGDDPQERFRIAAEGPEAIMAYRKFLEGGALAEVRAQVMSPKKGSNPN
jgi:hypothetical protein